MKKQILSLMLVLTLTLALTVPVFAATNVKITDDYDVNHKFSYTIPNVIKTEKMQAADAPKWTDANKYGGYSKAGKTVTVYTVAVGTKLKFPEAFGMGIATVEYKNGKLQNSSVDVDTCITVKEDWSRQNRADGGWHNVASSKAYVQINKEGYYLVSHSPFVWDSFDGKNGFYYENKYKYYTAMIHVVKDGESTKADTKMGTAENPYTFKDIPKSWVKETKTNGVVTGYTVTVPNKKAACFKISGTQFESAKIKDKDGKTDDTVKLTSGKSKSIKDATTLSLKLRKAAK